MNYALCIIIRFGKTVFIEEICLRDFRNYESLRLPLAPGVNLFCGGNAQGKTNLVEAVYFLCVGRSPRTPRDKELLRWNAEAAYIAVQARRKHGNVKVEGYLTKTDKRLRINGLPLSRMGELMGAMTVVFFSPDELKIVKAGPTDRRRFMDIDLSQLSKTYFYDVTRYNKILAQRNRLLKTHGKLDDQLDIWDGQLADAGARVTSARAKLIAKLAPFARAAHERLTDGKESLVLTYEGFPGWEKEDKKAAFLQTLQESRGKDVFHGYTHEGAHKDDIAFGIGDTDIRTYGSQGQQRTAVLALKLAELQLFAEATGEPPVLILDDVLSELDADRRAKLLEGIAGVQTLITCTDPGDLNPAALGAAVYKVRAGSVQRAE
jgi:DNA replication and repair protein RecF